MLNFNVLFWLTFCVHSIAWLAVFIGQLGTHATPKHLGRGLLIGVTALYVYLCFTLWFVDKHNHGETARLFLSLALGVLCVFWFLSLCFRQIQGQGQPDKQRGRRDFLLSILPFIALLLLLVAGLLRYELGEQTPIFVSVQGYTILAHVALVLGGYLMFTLSFVLSVVFIYREKAIKQKSIKLMQSNLPELYWFQESNLRLISWGFVLLLIGIVLGLSIDFVSLGSWLSLRVLLPLLVLAVYGFLLLDVIIVGKRGRRAAILSLLGFSLAILSFAQEIQSLNAG